MKQGAPTSTELVPTSTVAARLGISRERVVRLAQRGILEAEEIAGRYLIRAASVDAYERQQESNAAPASR